MSESADCLRPNLSRETGSRSVLLLRQALQLEMQYEPGIKSSENMTYDCGRAAADS